MDAKKYYSLESKNDVADLYIFGDITSWPWLESDVSASGIVNELQSLDAKEINVHINSYGGEVAEGLAIYNTLKNSDMKVTTICDGFACSAASVIFMAGHRNLNGYIGIIYGVECCSPERIGNVRCRCCYIFRTMRDIWS